MDMSVIKIHKVEKPKEYHSENDKKVEGTNFKEILEKNKYGTSEKEVSSELGENKYVSGNIKSKVEEIEVTEISDEKIEEVLDNIMNIIIPFVEVDLNSESLQLELSELTNKIEECINDSILTNLPEYKTNIEEEPVVKISTSEEVINLSNEDKLQILEKVVETLKEDKVVSRETIGKIFNETLKSNSIPEKEPIVDILRNSTENIKVTNSDLFKEPSHVDVINNNLHISYTENKDKVVTNEQRERFKNVINIINEESSLKSVIEVNKVDYELEIPVQIKVSINNDESSFAKFSSEENKENEILTKIIDGEESNTSNKGSFISPTTPRYINSVKVESTPVINKNTVSSDVIKSIKFMDKNLIKELSVKIYPKELGEVTIKLISEDSIMRAELKVTSKETYNLINANINDIKNAIEQQEIKISDVNISIYQEDATFYTGEGFSEGNFNQERRNNNLVDTNSDIDELQVNEAINEDVTTEWIV